MSVKVVDVLLLRRVCRQARIVLWLMALGAVLQLVEIWARWHGGA